METTKLSKRTLFAYGCGDFASNLCWTFIGSYLSVFYTDVVGMAPAVASAIMLIAKIWDGINDPMFGAIAERTNTKKGRFRPYIFYGAPFLAVLSVLAFTTFGKGNTAIVWAAVTYIGCGMLYTVVNLSYGSLSTVMTTDAGDIAQLNSYRMMGTNLSSVLLNAITAPLLMKFSGGAEGYTAGAYTKVALLFAICALPLFYFVYASCKETVHPPKSAVKVPVSRSIKSVVTNGPLMLIFLIQLIAMTAFFGRMGVVIYYLMYNVQRFDLIAAFMSLPSLFTVVGILLTKNFIIRVGKKKMAAIGYIGAGIALILIFIVGKTAGYTNIPLLLILHCIYGFFCFSFPIPMAMVPDAINYEEERKGIRSDGTSYATVSLSTKFGSAFGVSGALLIMGATGYVANAQQSAEALNGINMTTNLVFGIMFLCCLIPLFFYPLNEKKSTEILESLQKKRALREAEIEN
ncbi:glycoside-pentoside-hexuronide (GPH):cation symporter [Faecalicatena sp. AGMB00832]|uniref:Glycoside-pentoside-hexuronide (GPH):cation symporter n=1 Tax=Faecalicatena faecalis TaxID=2726362 RepID=A0ABS6D6R1_9FIRM|nr:MULTISPECIES: glycoside-pentoside-hexuronide (GPH):cation symporter [Faecalicatena]MBU3876821.1 glycoside-pentoside-hexuronide (GPH):cation symporter [Faecalicatena faecalis]MCI6466166.1 glycoside-pentoside-hexuronide (GPH):cation symporter [Faecalicatena sp.]MDY5619331.1 glycoside-pentoside-hexuronide (GPH):cation symporter [Lachnospiraceae bacterium]